METEAASGPSVDQSLQREILDFKIEIQEQQKHKSWLCVDGKFISLEEAKQLRAKLDDDDK